MKLQFNRFPALILVLASQFSFAQERSVSRIVSYNTGTPPRGPGKLVKGTKNGTHSDFDGKYTTKTKPSSTLVLDNVGMKNSKLLASSTTVDLKLRSTMTQLKDVLVTFVAIKKQKRTLGLAMANIRAKEITLPTGRANSNVLKETQGILN